MIFLVYIQNLPFLLLDHEQMIIKALELIPTQLSYQPVGLNLLRDKFTLPELQKLYETILDRKIDRHNFQKKILSMDILRRLDQHRKIGPHCSPNLYLIRLNTKKHSWKVKDLDSKTMYVV